MKYALVDGEKNEAVRGTKGICPGCSTELIPHCGESIMHHWAHKGDRNCDHWWENETEWHRKWKAHFPKESQEIVHFDQNGEKHIADVKTESELVIEFQHSYLKPEERRSRIAFYQKMVWVVDGLRRKNDKSQFFKLVEEASVLRFNKLVILRIGFPEESKIIREWVSDRIPTLFDFQESQRVWLMIPASTINQAYIIPIGVSNFVDYAKKGLLEGVIKNLVILTSEYNNHINKQKQKAAKRRANQVLHKRLHRKQRRRF